MFPPHRVRQQRIGIPIQTGGSTRPLRHHVWTMSVKCGSIIWIVTRNDAAECVDACRVRRSSRISDDKRMRSVRTLSKYTVRLDQRQSNTVAADEIHVQQCVTCLRVVFRRHSSLRTNPRHGGRLRWCKLDCLLITDFRDHFSSHRGSRLHS